MLQNQPGVRSCPDGAMHRGKANERFELRTQSSGPMFAVVMGLPGGEATARQGVPSHVAASRPIAVRHPDRHSRWGHPPAPSCNPALLVPRPSALTGCGSWAPVCFRDHIEVPTHQGPRVPRVLFSGGRRSARVACSIGLARVGEQVQGT